jgi:hypothetical protein
MADKITAFLVRRDEEGKPVPYEVDVLGIREKALKIKILPTTISSLKGLSAPEKDAVQWPVEDKLRYIREHIVEPDFGATTDDELKDTMTQWDLDMLLVTAIQNGGPMRSKLGGKKKNPTLRSGRSRKK